MVSPALARGSKLRAIRSHTGFALAFGCASPGARFVDTMSSSLTRTPKPEQQATYRPPFMPKRQSVALLKAIDAGRFGVLEVSSARTINAGILT